MKIKNFKIRKKKFLIMKFEMMRVISVKIQLKFR